MDVFKDQSHSDQLKRKRPRKRNAEVKQEKLSRRSSAYRGVTRHKWTGRYEAHLWDKNCWNQSQNKKGRQVYLGAYDKEEAAARAYDLAALKYWGPGTTLNFPINVYAKDLEEMKGITKEEYLATLRRKSSGFSRGVSKYRGVARHHHNGRWEARIGRIFGNKYLYLGTYSTQEEAAAAYDLAAIEYRGLHAVTNFDLSHYVSSLKPGQAGIQNIGLSAQTMQQLPTVKKEKDEFSNQQFSTAVTMATQEGVSQVPEEVPNDSQKSLTRPTTALGLLLQSAKFKDMLQRTSTDNIIKNSVITPKAEPKLQEEISYMNFDFSAITEEQYVPFICSSPEFSDLHEELLNADLSELLPVPLDLSLEPYLQWLNE